MNAALRSQLLQSLHTRRDTIAGSWYKAVTHNSFVPLSATEVRQRFIELTEQVITLLLAEPFERRQAEAIGVSLVRLHYVQPEALGKTQEVLAHRLVEGLPADQVVVLQPRLAALLSGLAAGFFHQARETILAEQEQIRSALITERKRAEETLQLRNRELALLNQVNQTLNSTLDPGQVFVAILEAMRDLMGVSACSIWLTDPATGEMVCQQAAAGAQSEVVRGWRLAPGEGIAGWVARHGESLIVPDAREDERHCKSVGQQIGLEIRSLLSIPLKVRQDVIGVLEAVDTEAGRFDATHVTSLEPLAASAAIAIENARMYKQAQQEITERKRAEAALREHTGRLKILHEIDNAILAAHSLGEIAQATLRRIRRLVTCQRASIVLFDLEASEGTILAAHGYSQAMPGEGERFSLGTRAVAELCQGKVYVLDHLLDPPQPPPTIQALQAEELHSCTCVPLISQGKLIGSLNLWTENPGSLTLEHTDIAWEVADSLAIAIQHARLDEAVRQQGQRLRNLAARLAETEENERQQMARELHDQVGQNLTVLGINLNLVRAHMPEQTPALARSRLDDSLALIEETIERTRDVMANLRPPMLDDYGLVATLHWYSERFASWAGISVTVYGEEPVPRLAAPAENALFRIAQEALTNVCKHAQATQVTVMVTADEEAVSLVIADDGSGFDPAQLTTLDERRGWGLMTMAERAEAVGGFCRIESRPQQGTRVIVEVAR